MYAIINHISQVTQQVKLQKRMFLVVSLIQASTQFVLCNKKSAVVIKNVHSATNSTTIEHLIKICTQ